MIRVDTQVEHRDSPSTWFFFCLLVSLFASPARHISRNQVILHRGVIFPHISTYFHGSLINSATRIQTIFRFWTFSSSTKITWKSFSASPGRIEALLGHGKCSPDHAGEGLPEGLPLWGFVACQKRWPFEQREHLEWLGGVAPFF